MKRRNFLGALPFAAGGAVLMQGSAAASPPLVAAPPLWANVKAYGAKGDGKTDDTSAIKSAMASLLKPTDSRGGVLYFPAGTYVCSSTLAFTSYDLLHNIIVRGDGPTCTVLDFATAGAGAHGLSFGFGSQFGVEDIEIANAKGDGIIVGDGNPVFVGTYSFHFAIRNVRVQFCGGNGFTFTNAYMGTLSDCWSYANAGIGYLFNGYHTSINVSRCYALSNTGIGWSLNAMTYSSFTACGSDSNLWGYTMTNMTGVSFTACGAEKNKREGWFLMTNKSTQTGLPPQVRDIHGVVFTSCCSFQNSQVGTNAYGDHLAAVTADGGPIQFKMTGNTSFCNDPSTVSMVLNGASGAITVHDELCSFNGSWITSGTVTRKTL